MQSKALWGCCVMWCLASVGGRALAQDRAVTTGKSEENRIVPVDPAVAIVEEAPEPIHYVPLEEGTVFERHVVLADDADVAAVVSEQLVYTNPLGTFMAALGGGNLVSDDLTITVPNGCKLTRYEFKVVGKVDPAGVGGEYTVKFALYRSCPGSVPVASRPGLIIPGTQGQKIFTLPDADAPALISFVAGSNVPLQTNMWLGVQFSRNNAGVIVGAPPLQGFSCDQFDFPGFPCDNDLGGFPDSPQASFDLQIYADSACSASFTGYKNDKPSGVPWSPGQNVVFADDIQLVNGDCNLIGYEVAVQNAGFYTFDMRPTCEGPAIAGTQRTFTGSGTDVKIARLIVDPPVALPQNLWFSAKIGSTGGRVIVSGQQACIGQTEDRINFIGDAGCNLVDPADLGTGIHGAFSLTITCAGPAPVGACCDMYMTDPDGAAVCRQVPETNCPFPPRFSSLQPRWVEVAPRCDGGEHDGDLCQDDPTRCEPGGGVCTRCSPDPFGNHPCGQAACCYADQQADQCRNLTLAACDQAGDPTRPRQWQIGRYCNDGGQRCPKIACLGRAGECTLPRCQPGSACTGGANDGLPCTTNAQCPPGPPNARCDLCGGVNCHVGPACCDSCPPVGCEDADCCTEVCNFPPDGPYCCDVEWDDACASLAADTQLNLCAITPANDVCAPTRVFEGARLLTLVNGFATAETDHGRATADAGDPSFGCYVDNPGKQGLQTVWYKFVATQTSALFQTCASNAPAVDSLLEVFAVGDMSTELTQCRSLIPIGCSDDFPGCSSSNKNSRICVQGLTPGNLYYVLVAAKTALLPGKKYRLDIQAPCNCSGGTCDPVPNNDCPRATTITDGTTHFGPDDLPKATLTAPIEPCIPGATRDVWYRYKATCTGTLTAETCNASNPPASPDTNLAVYDQGLCPYNPVSPAALACSTNAPDCSPGSKLQTDVVKDSFYTIRLADEAGNAPQGDLKVACVQENCPAGEMTITSPPSGVVDAGRPSDPNNAALLQGIKTITVTAPHAALASCFTLCDTAFPVPANSVVSAVEDPALPGTYTITLARPITAGALTTLTYTDVHGLKSSGRFSSHPANVNADAVASAADVQRLVDILNGTGTPPWGVYSDDIDRSIDLTPPATTGVTPADILEVVDLLNGAGAYDPWNGTPNPSSSTACPPP